MTEKTSTGAELAEHRRTLGLTQEDVARRLGVSRVTVANWEASASVPYVKAENYRLAANVAAREALVGDWSESEKRLAFGDR